MFSKTSKVIRGMKSCDFSERVSLSKATAKAVAIIKQSDNPLLLKTARRYVDNLAKMYKEETKLIGNLRKMLGDQDMAVHDPKFSWESFNLEAYINGAAEWGEIQVINIPSNLVILRSYSGQLPDWVQPLEGTMFRPRKPS